MRKYIVMLGLAVSAFLCTLSFAGGNPPPPFAFPIPSSGGGISGGASTITVSAHTTTGDIANTETVIGTRVTNTGATGTITLTLPQCSTTHYSVAVYLTEAQAVVLTPYSGDQFMVLTSAADKTLTSGATAGSFIAFECLASGKWYPTGLNGAWTSN